MLDSPERVKLWWEEQDVEKSGAFAYRFGSFYFSVYIILTDLKVFHKERSIVVVT